MSVLNQKTINENITFKDVGLHSGLEVTMTIKPSEPNSGIIFKRVDLKKNNIIIPNVFNVSKALFCTTISNEAGSSVSTIEHLMGALYGLGIDNAFIEVDNDEVPMLDGSAKLFVEAISKTGIRISNAPIKVIKINNKITFKDGKKMLERVISENLLTAKAVFGLFPASRDGDDIRIYHHESGQQKVKIHNLRQQIKKTAGKPNYCLSDFIYPSASEIPDYIGAFAVTAGIGLDEISNRFKDELDDYQSILIQSISDRLAEALAEKLHEDVRTNYWGYGEHENLNYSDLLRESYSGIRPAPGYPANPDHSEKTILFDLLEINDDPHITLTESFALHPASSVCGWYYAHPDSKYFNVGKISTEQSNDYGSRKGLDQKTVNQLLQTILAGE